MQQEKIDRINELARIAKVRDLTKDEEKERYELRAEYVRLMRQNLVAQLENTYIVDEDGNKKKLEKKSDKEKQ